MMAFADGGKRQYSFFVRVEYREGEGPPQIGTLPRPRSAAGEWPVTVQSEGVKESPSGEDLAQGADKLELVSDKRGREAMR